MANKEDIKTSITSTGSMAVEIKNAIESAKSGTMQVGTTVRLVLLIISWLNQIAVTFVGYEVPGVPDSVIYCISCVITVVFTAIAYWKNNSWSSNAKVSDQILKLLNDSGVDSDTLIDSVSEVIEKATEKTGNNKEETPVE